MKRLLIWSAALILIFGLLVIASRAIGGSSTSSTATVADVLFADSYLGSQGWCWRGICPGQTSLSAALTQLKDPSDGSETGTLSSLGSTYYWVPPDHHWSVNLDSTSEDGVVQKIAMNVVKEHLDLGDLVLWFGEPVSIQLCMGGDENGNGPYPIGRIFFQNGVYANFFRVHPSKDLRATLDFIVSDINFDLSAREAQNAKRANAMWRGFGLYPRCN